MEETVNDNATFNAFFIAVVSTNGLESTDRVRSIPQTDFRTGQDTTWIITVVALLASSCHWWHHDAIQCYTHKAICVTRVTQCHCHSFMSAVSRTDRWICQLCGNCQILDEWFEAGDLSMYYRLKVVGHASAKLSQLELHEPVSCRQQCREWIWQMTPMTDCHSLYLQQCYIGWSHDICIWTCQPWNVHMIYRVHIYFV